MLLFPNVRQSQAKGLCASNWYQTLQRFAGSCTTPANFTRSNFVALELVSTTIIFASPSNFAGLEAGPNEPSPVASCCAVSAPLPELGGFASWNETKAYKP